MYIYLLCYSLLFSLFRPKWRVPGPFHVNFDSMQNSRARFTMIFDIAQDCHTPTISRPTINDLNTSSLAQIAQVVASTSQLFNIVDVTQWAHEHPEILPTVDDELKETNAVLCMPIINAQKNVIGVVQFINKVRISFACEPIENCKIAFRLPAQWFHIIWVKIASDLLE